MDVTELTNLSNTPVNKKLNRTIIARALRPFSREQIQIFVMDEKKGCKSVTRVVM
jgi:hypothetical protein